MTEEVAVPFYKISFQNKNSTYIYISNEIYAIHGNYVKLESHEEGSIIEFGFFNTYRAWSFSCSKYTRA